MKLLQQQTTDELSTQPLETLSNMYQFVNSKDIKETLVNKHGLDFEGISFSSLRTNKEQRLGKQKHVMSFNTNIVNNDGDFVRLLVTNNYEGKGSLIFNLGLFRMVCANGIIVGNSVFEQRIIHKGKTVKEQIEEVMEIVAKSSKNMIDRIDNMKSQTMSNTDFNEVLTQLLDFKHGENHHKTDLSQFTPKRSKDQGNDLWTRFNIAQEYLIKGGYKTSLIDLNNSVLGNGSNVINATFKKERQIKEVRSIDINRKLNQECWNQFEKVAA